MKHGLYTKDFCQFTAINMVQSTQTHLPAYTALLKSVNLSNHILWCSIHFQEWNCSKENGSTLPFGPFHGRHSYGHTWTLMFIQFAVHSTSRRFFCMLISLAHFNLLLPFPVLGAAFLPRDCTLISCGRYIYEDTFISPISQIIY